MFKKIATFLMMFCAICSLSAQINLADDNVRQSLYGALDQAKASIAKAPFNGKTVAILPIAGDADSLILGRLKNILSDAKVKCIEGKEDPMWAEIMKEIAWNQRKEDILDQQTIVKFGKLKAAQVVLYGKVRVLDQNEDRIYAEIELHATDLATKAHIWGGNFACRYYLGQDIRGIISLDVDLKNLLKKNFEEAKKSLQEPATAAKLNKKTVAVVPLAGDIDSYMTNLAIEMLTATTLQPKYPQIPSLSQIKAFARDGQMNTDLVFYGAIRDLYRGKTTAKMVSNENNEPIMEEKTDIFVDIQLTVEDLKTGIILWSKTITLHEEVVKERDHLTPAEQEIWDKQQEMSRKQMEEAAKEKADAEAKEKEEAEEKAAAEKEEAEEKAAQEKNKEEEQAKENRIKFYAILIAILIGGIALIWFIVWCIKAWASYHDVR